MAKRGLSPPLKKLQWGEVPKEELYTSEEWKALLASVRTFSYAVNGFKKADRRYSSDQGDGQLWCNEEQCPNKKFGASPHTQAEFSAFKHVLAYHSPGPIEEVAVQGGPPKKMKQAVLGFTRISSDEKRRRDEKAHADRMRAQLARQRAPAASSPAASSPAASSPAAAEDVVLTAAIPVLPPEWLRNMLKRALETGNSEILSDKITTAEREGVKNFAKAKTRGRSFKQRRVDKKAADSNAAVQRRLEAAAETWAATQEAAGTTDAL